MSVAVVANTTQTLKEVQCYTFRDLLVQNGVTKVDFVRIDATTTARLLEGSEKRSGLLDMGDVKVGLWQIDISTHSNTNEEGVKTFFQAQGLCFVEKLAGHLFFRQPCS